MSGDKYYKSLVRIYNIKKIHGKQFKLPRKLKKIQRAKVAHQLIWYGLRVPNERRRVLRWVSGGAWSHRFKTKAKRCLDITS